MQALVTGGSSKFGAALVSELSKTYDVMVIPRDQLATYTFVQHSPWKYDLIFFNHHFMPEGFDYASYHMNCLVPIDILSNNKSAKVGWMVSSGIGAKDHPEYAPYFAYKSMNVHIMRYYAHQHPEIYFGVDPGHLIEGHYETPAKQVVALLDKVESGKVYTLNGSVSGL